MTPQKPAPIVDARTENLIDQALQEDGAHNDVTTRWTVSETQTARAVLFARQKGILCGGPLFSTVFRKVSGDLRIEFLCEEGEKLSPDQEVAVVSGRARGILSGERVALNLIGRFSGIATLTGEYVSAIEGTGAVVCDTRKTTPLWRKWEKYAVRIGGGENHRFDLEEMVLVKDNHIRLAGGIRPALEAVRSRNEGKIQVEIEVDDLDQLQEVLSFPEPVDRILLDNMDTETLVKAVDLAGGRVVLEASGGIRLDNVRKIAETGIDLISVGALTHSAPALDFSLEMAQPM